MTSVNDASAPASEAPSPERTVVQTVIAGFEDWLGQIGEQLNPILVKEARQAMKSRQFTVTFTLLLVFGWLWSIVGVATQMPNVYYVPTGLYMLVGYYFILAAPLLLVVPFSAYRSLASEREDGTYELLSISTLSSAPDCHRQARQCAIADDGLLFSACALHRVYISFAWCRYRHSVSAVVLYVLHFFAAQCIRTRLRGARSVTALANADFRRPAVGLGSRDLGLGSAGCRDPQRGY